MNNINTNNYSEKSNKSSRWNKLPYTLLLVSLLSLNNPTEAKAVNTYNFNQQNVEVLADSGIVSNIERRTWTVLPRLYADKIRTFVKNSKVIEGSEAKFTEDFIVNQMKSNWWISKQNQLLFIWDAIYEQITKKNFYDWEDWDNNRLSEFENAMDSIEVCWKKYREQITSYMKQQSAEARQQSAEARQQSAETIKETMRADSLWLKEMIKFYNIYQRNPSIVKEGEIIQAKWHAEHFIKDCKKFWINYRAILLKEVWWYTKKVDKILKFYGIE